MHLSSISNSKISQCQHNSYRFLTFMQGLISPINVGPGGGSVLRDCIPSFMRLRVVFITMR